MIASPQTSGSHRDASHRLNLIRPGTVAAMESENYSFYPFIPFEFEQDGGKIDAKCQLTLFNILG